MSGVAGVAISTTAKSDDDFLHPSAIPHSAPSIYRETLLILIFSETR